MGSKKVPGLLLKQMEQATLAVGKETKNTEKEYSLELITPNIKGNLLTILVQVTVFTCMRTVTPMKESGKKE